MLNSTLIFIFGENLSLFGPNVFELGKLKVQKNKQKMTIFGTNNNFAPWNTVSLY